MHAICLCGRGEWTFGCTNLDLRGTVHEGDLIFRNQDCMDGMQCYEMGYNHFTRENAGGLSQQNI